MKQLRANILSNKRIGAVFYSMRLSEKYLAKNSAPGQFIEIRCTKGTNPLLRRPLGVHRIWPDGIEIMYEVVGKGTALLTEMRPGESLDIIGPLGNGFNPDLTNGTSVLVAGGIGVAPLVSLAQKISDGRALAASKRGKICVFLGARTKSHILCEDEFKKFGCRPVITTDDGSKGKRGFITDALKSFLSDGRNARPAAIYSCGSTAMLKVVRDIARKHAIPCQVSLEERMACGVGVCLGCPVKVKEGGYKMVCKDGPVFDAEELAW